VPSPLGIAAGPLLNGRWVLHYAALGLDILTTRSVQRAETGALSEPVRGLRACETVQESWTILFGMPSKAPDVWPADVAWMRVRLPRGSIAHPILLTWLVSMPHENRMECAAG
jgi:dihydroorotate dehydrogenase (NAD+) catalytic subunit